MITKTGGRNWRMLLGIGTLVLAVLISISGFLGGDYSYFQDPVGWVER